jgi:hypothetical protein
LVRNKAVHIALGVRADGGKEILGCGEVAVARAGVGKACPAGRVNTHPRARRKPGSDE